LSWAEVAPVVGEAIAELVGQLVSEVQPEFILAAESTTVAWNWR